MTPTLFERVFLRPRRAALLAAGLALVVNVGAVANGFAFDDEAVVAGDPALRSLSGLGHRLTEPYWPSSFGQSVGLWRPLTTLTFAVSWVAGDGSPAFFHAVGVMLHATATALVVLLLAAFVPPAVAALAGILFAVHPVHVEAVANVVGLEEPLGAVFCLLAALIWVGDKDRIGPLRAAVVGAFYALAVLTKEGAAVLPALLFLLDATREDPGVRDVPSYVARRGWAFGLLAGVLGLVLVGRWSVLGTVASPSAPPGAWVLLEIPRIWTLAGVWPHYLRLLIAPFELVADYAPGVVRVAFGWTAWAALGAALTLAMLTLALVTWRRGGSMTPSKSSSRVLGFGVVWVGFSVLPVANVFFLSGILLAERTLYLASVGAVAALAWVLVALVEQRRRLGMSLAATLVLAYAVRSVSRIPTWKSSDAVWATLLDEHPESGRAWWALGRRLAVDGRPREANHAYGVSLGLLNSEHQVALDAAANLLNSGRLSSARFFARRAWAEHPEWYAAPGLLAAIELNDGRPAEAAAAARAATLLAPENPSMHHLLARALAAQGRPGEAVVSERRALDAGFRDRWRTWLQYGQDLAAAGDTTGALAAFDSAAARAPGRDERDEIGRARSALVLLPEEHD